QIGSVRRKDSLPGGCQFKGRSANRASAVEKPERHCRVVDGAARGVIRECDGEVVVSSCSWRHFETDPERVAVGTGGNQRSWSGKRQRRGAWRSDVDKSR